MLSHGPPQGSRWSTRELRDGHVGPVEGVAFSPDGLRLASADNSGTIIVRSIPDFDIVAMLHGRNFTEVAWSADGTTLVAGGFDSLLYIWRKPFTQPPDTLRYPGQVEAVALRDEVVIGAGGGDHSIRRWNLVFGTELLPFRGHSDDIYAVRVSPDGKIVVSGGRDRTIRVWNATTGHLMRILRDHDSVYDLTFSPDGVRLVSACRDGTIRIWNTHTWKAERLLRGPENSVHGVAVSPNGQWLAGAGFDNRVWVWSLPGAASPLTLAGHRRKVSGVAFSPDGRWLASAASDTSVRLWSVP